MRAYEIFSEAGLSTATFADDAGRLDNFKNRLARKDGQNGIVELTPKGKQKFGSGTVQLAKDYDGDLNKFPPQWPTLPGKTNIAFPIQSVNNEDEVNYVLLSDIQKTKEFGSTGSKKDTSERQEHGMIKIINDNAPVKMKMSNKLIAVKGAYSFEGMNELGKEQYIDIMITDTNGKDYGVSMKATASMTIGGGGNDLLNGDAGDDVFLVFGADDGFDRLSGGSGFDQVIGGDGDDVIGFSSYFGEDTVEEIDGGGGENVIQSDIFRSSLDFSETILTNISRIEGGSGRDTITGSTGNDSIFGGDGNDNLFGGDGGDLLDAGNGADRLFGDAGDDRLIVENDDFLLIDGGANIDTIVVDFALDLTSVADNRIENIERFDLRGGSDVTLTIGLDDVLAAASETNALTGGDSDLVVRRDAGDTVNVVGDNWETSQESIDTDEDGVVEGYTVFNDADTGATVYVENAQPA